MRGYLGNQGRNRPKGPRHGGGGMRDGNRDGNRDNRGNNGGPRDDMMHEPEVFDGDNDAEVISPAELTQSRSSMNLTELKAKPIHELVKMAESMGVSKGTIMSRLFHARRKLQKALAACYEETFDSPVPSEEQSP